MQAKFCDPAITVITVGIITCCQQMATKKEHFLNTFFIFFGHEFVQSTSRRWLFLRFYLLLVFVFVFHFFGGCKCCGKEGKNATPYCFLLIICFFPCICIVNQEPSVRKRMGSLQ